ncbi:transmembrane 9 superfamily member 9-like [Primulina huaijiensis]|uniref:transmembrane 9 superfamily member 9-like n=1 Tax=Primulina huaijiensis TaxID=1492673 RepID=UPI003CC794C3
MNFFERLPGTIQMYLCRLAGGYLMLVLHGLYLPGAGPKDFVQGDPLTVKVQRLASVKTQLPYSYYSLPDCIQKKIVDNRVNLGEFLSSALIAISSYEFETGELQMCNVVCRTILNAKDAKELKERIDHNIG